MNARPYRLVTLTRALLARHLADLLALDRAALPEPWTAAEFELELPEKWVFSRLLLLPDNRLAGYQVASRKGTALHLHRIALHAAVRGQGLGTEMSRHLVAGGAAAGVERVTMKVALANPIARAAWARMGFRVVAVRPPNLELAATPAEVLATVPARELIEW